MTVSELVGVQKEKVAFTDTPVTLTKDVQMDRFIIC